MSSLAKLKDEARRHEQREEWQQAIDLYLRVLRGGDGVTEVDLPLYNRVGDLFVRMGRPADAVNYYEEAADRYAEAGLHNNAIALCNKALRYTPNRPELYRKVGHYCALQGFTTDARRWFLEYAERAFAQGELAEALSALDDFADLAEDASLRELLGRLLHKYDRMEDSLREFRRAYGLLLNEGDDTGAERLRDDAMTLFPDLEELEPEELAPKVSADRDTSDDNARLPGIGEAVPDASATAPSTGQHETGSGADAAGSVQAGSLEGLESTDVGEGSTGGDPGGAAVMPGFEPTSLTADDEAASPEGEDDGESASPLPLLGSAPAHTPEPETRAGTPVDEAPRGASLKSAAGLTASALPDSEYVDLLDLIGLEQERSTDTRFRIEERAPTGDEDRDFAELLAQFKAKLAEHVPEDDAASHYDLGLAFREMGLVDEAINEFQRALRAGDARLKILEELGQCFIEKGQHNIAVKVLARALQLQREDDLELIGVYYHLGRAYESLGHNVEARDAYERVMGLDISFRDVSERIVRL